MNYDFDLNSLPFESIKSGKKKIETRTKVPHNMTPYEKILKGDILTFTHEKTKEVMIVEDWE